jgi:hypothetical protein
MPDPVTRILEEMRRYGEAKKRLRLFAENSSKKSKVRMIMKEVVERDESNDKPESKEGRRIAVFGSSFC